MSIYTINNKILCLGFNILHTKIPLYKYLNSLNYPYLLYGTIKYMVTLLYLFFKWKFIYTIYLFSY